ncbi:MAG: hypothetical protein H6671_15150 [Anaerolineaceae bacterium]|nr:hypothetical protein [Anaerolineaceae bacterium]
MLARVGSHMTADYPGMSEDDVAAMLNNLIDEVRAETRVANDEDDAKESSQTPILSLSD